MTRKDNRRELMDAIHLRRPARLPFTFDAERETEVMLRRHLGLADGADLHDHFGCNRLSSPWEACGKGPTLPERAARNRTGDPRATVDIWGVRRELQQAGDANYWEVTANPLAGVRTVADVEAYDWPRPEEVVFPDLPAGFDLAAWKADRVVLDCGWISPFGIPWNMRGLERMMVDLAEEPAIVEAMVAKVEEFNMGCLPVLFAKYPGLVDLIGCGDDLGSQNGLLMSPGMFGEFFMPSLKRHYDLARRHGVLGYHHCCGAIFRMVPFFVEAGVKVLNPIQTSAVGMDPVRLKADFGRDLCFHGAIDTQQTLFIGTPDDVRREVRERIAQLGPEGYILAPSHLLQPNVPPENIVAMYDEAAAWRGG